jgi:hypothetical protein
MCLGTDNRTSLGRLANKVENQTTTDHIKVVERIVRERPLKKVLLEYLRVIRFEVDWVIIDPRAAACIIIVIQRSELQQSTSVSCFHRQACEMTNLIFS